MIMPTSGNDLYPDTKSRIGKRSGRKTLERVVGQSELVSVTERNLL
jgi:hypothetical protein